MQRFVIASMLLGLVVGGCAPGRGNHASGDDDDDDDASDADGDADTDSDSDTDSDTDSDSDSDGDGDGDADPPSPELCADGLDNDRDGNVDEECECEAGATQACFRGRAGARGLGICHDGQQTCEDHFEFATWGACEGDQLPGDETCGDGLDNDCDGRVDDGCGEPECDVGEFAEEQDCNNGEDEDCDGLVDCDDPDCAAECGECAANETCGDGVDNDCDGLTDCGDSECDCGGDEDCNGLDDDGDGRIDEGRACGDAGDGDGACPPGAWRICDAYCGVHQQCNDQGAWGPCLVDSTCEGVPECDQHEDCDRGYYCDYGSCSPGTFSFSPCESDEDCTDPFGGLLGDSTCQVDQGVCIQDCYHHSDCGNELVCDLGMCVEDPYQPGQC